MRFSRMLFIAAFALYAIGCGGGAQNDQGAAEDSLQSAVTDTSPMAGNDDVSPPATGEGAGGGAEPADRGRSSRDEPPPAREEPPARVERTSVVPAGTGIAARLDQRLSTKDDAEGEPFSATTLEDVRVSGRNVIPAGSTVRGTLHNLKRAPNVGGSAKMTLRFTEIETPAGNAYPVAATDLHLEGKSTTKGDVEKVLGGAVGGAILGGILGGKKGAGRGAAVGGAAGAVIAVATKGHDIVLEPGTDVQVNLEHDLSVRAPGGGTTS